MTREAGCTEGCAYCGLPVAAEPAAAVPRYCCFGCRFAASITAANGAAGESRWLMTRLGLAVFFTMNVMVFTMLLWSERAGPVEPAAVAFYSLARHACLLFTAPVVILLGEPLFREAWRELAAGRPAVNLLLASGVAAALVLSLHAIATNRGHVYFEVACMVLIAVTLGRWLEAAGKLRTTEALRSLRAILPDSVRRIGCAGEETVLRADLRVGDRIRVLPGERIPTDAVIVAGRAAIDERTVTGESIPVTRQLGDAVASGTEVIDGPLVLGVTALPGAGRLEKLIDAVMDAVAAGTGPQRLADRVATWFLRIVMATAAGAFLIHGAWSGWTADGVAAGTMAAIAVVVVSCPCALGLATPMALWASVGAAARRHVLVRDADALLRLGTATTFCFDKTGTLTTALAVRGVFAEDGTDADEVLVTAAALARESTHVLARAIVVEAEGRDLPAIGIDTMRVVAGRGIEGRLADGRLARLGSDAWLGFGPTATDATTRSPDRPSCRLAIGGSAIGRIEFDESLRPEADATITALCSAGAEVWLLSGDRESRAVRVAAALGMHAAAPLLPEEKLAFVRRHAPAVMVGDGINDAPALVAADVGVALGCGADVSRWTASICLLRDDLGDLPWLVDLARRTNRTIRWNLLWAFGYNAVCIPLAATGLVHPAVAAAAMVASSLFVVSGSLALARDAEPAPDMSGQEWSGGRRTVAEATA